MPRTQNFTLVAFTWLRDYFERLVGVWKKKEKTMRRKPLETDSSSSAAKAEWKKEESRSFFVDYQLANWCVSN